MDVPLDALFGTDFKFDFNVRFTKEQQREGSSDATTGAREVAVARRRGAAVEIAVMTGTDVVTYTRERPGMSALALEDDVVYQSIPPTHVEWTASGACTQWLERAEGRNEKGVW